MPSIWTEPELAVRHNGVSVYHVYKNGFWGCGRLKYHYTTDIAEQDSFDIRDLPSYQDNGEHTKIPKQAIERGEIAAPME